MSRRNFRTEVFGSVIRGNVGMCVLVGLSMGLGQLPAVELTPPEREFFESRIRPVLAENCYECHNSSGKAKGGLTLDWRDGLRRGGSSGSALNTNRADNSLLLRVIRHELDDLRMPKDGAKLSDDVVADFSRWVEMGAPDPREKPPTPGELATATSWERIVEGRKRWWSLLPVAKHEPPAVGGGSGHPVDRFIESRLEKEGVQPATSAAPRTLIRRLTYTLTGLPPTPEEIRTFLDDESPDAYDALVTRLLESPRFGERWAQHWLDWFRYAESHGSEGDPRIPHAWRYRDYLIRALNGNVPYDQLVREHIAGDLLPHPRIDKERGINESAIGTAHYRMVLHGYAPTDPLDELVTFTDNQIDVISKAFLGMTVSCARCHNHKFDAISQEDFYSLFGILASCRPALITVDTPERLERHSEALQLLKNRIREKLAPAWKRSLDGFARELEEAPHPTPEAELEARNESKKKRKNREEEAPDRWQEAIDEAVASEGRSPLHAWTALRDLEEDALRSAWKKLEANWHESLTKKREHETRDYPLRWDLTREADYREWYRHGAGLPERPSPAGEFHVLSDDDRVISSVYPSGVYTHLLSSKHNGVLASPRLAVDTKRIHVRLLGKGPRARLVLQNYPRQSGPIYRQNARPQDDRMTWYEWDTTYWLGETAHVEVATAGDFPVEVRGDWERSWFGIAEIVVIGDGQEAPEETGAPLLSVAKSPADSTQEVIRRYVEALGHCLDAWHAGSISDEQANFLGYFVERGLLPNTLETLPDIAPLVTAYRALEADVPVPTRVPGLIEGDTFDQPLFVRGNHKKPTKPVPRQFLAALGGKPYRTSQSGRLELAEDILAPENPLTARVAANRIWHHVFGRGIAVTTDNLGRLGQEPTHPELLDYLASHLVEDGWSIKSMIRFLVTSQAYRRSSLASERARRLDPDNRLLSHMPVSRLEAEAIRDTLLAVSGDLDSTMYGPSIPRTGSEESSPRRSLYVLVRRNSLDNFLEVFDRPAPVMTRGRRDITNVPAQSLTLLNSPFVIERAQSWAKALMADRTLSEPEARIRRMFVVAFGREPTGQEIGEVLGHIGALAKELGLREESVATSLEVWQDVAHSLMNMKEFIYLE